MKGGDVMKNIDIELVFFSLLMGLAVVVGLILLVSLLILAPVFTVSFIACTIIVSYIIYILIK